jgi:hypothetical protein
MIARTSVLVALALAFAAQAQQPPAPQPRPPQYPQSQRPPQQGQPQPGQPPSQGAPVVTMASYGWFGELAGSCWKSVRAEGRTDVQCYEKQFNKFVRGSIKFYQNDKLTGEGDSVFAYDPNAKLIVYSQWVNNGSMGFGQATLVNGELIFQNHMPDGQDAPARSVWRKVDADNFRVSRQRRSDQGAWTEETGFTYTRVKPGG